jgi:hypothetical protein
MGVQDRDWYQEHWLRNVLGVRERKLRPRPIRRKRSYWPLLWVAMLMLGVSGCIAFVDVMRRLL